MQIWWYLERLLCEYMNLLAHRIENYFLMLKVLTLQLAKVRVGRWHLPAVFATGKYRHGQYSQKWRLPAFTGIYKYFINFSSNYIVDSPSYLLCYTWTPFLQHMLGRATSSDKMAVNRLRKNSIVCAEIN